MDEINTPIQLDSLDDDTAVFRGTDQVTVEHQVGPFGTVTHDINWPVVMIPKDAWKELGCPNMLMVHLSVVSVPDR